MHYLSLLSRDTKQIIQWNRIIIEKLLDTQIFNPSTFYGKLFPIVVFTRVPTLVPSVETNEPVPQTPSRCGLVVSMLASGNRVRGFKPG
jgi:hypothetical protein